MKKLLFLATLLLVGVASCSQNKAPDPQHNCPNGVCALPEAGTISDVVSEENWQFALPGDGWVPLQSPEQTVKVAFANASQQSIVFFVKDPTKLPPPDYIISVLRSFKEAGTTIQTAKQVVINNNQFIYVAAKGPSRQIYAWLTVKDGFGYILTCAADDDRDAEVLDQLHCASISNTLQIR
jgi:hypothetical protein